MAVNKSDYDNTYLKSIKEQNKKQYQKSNAEYKKNNQNNTGLFKKSSGGFWSTVGNSALDAGGNLIEGSLNAFEGISDWTRYRSADVLDFFGADKKAEKIRKEADYNTTEGIVSDWNHITAGDLSGSKTDEEIGHFKSVEENSVFGDKADSVFQGVGNSLTGAAIGSYLGAPVSSQKAKNLIGMTSFGVSATGKAEEEAISSGATRDEARLYGALSGTVEAGSEMLFGGLGKINQSLGFSKGALDDVIVNKFTKNMKSSLLRNITTLGIKSVGEGFEEVTSGFGNALAQKLTYMKEEDLNQLIKDQNLMDSFVSGMLSSAIMQSPSTVRYTAQGRDVNTGLTSTQQQYVNEIAQERMVEAQKRNAKLNGYEKSKIEQRALNDYQQGRLIDTGKLPLRTQQAVNLPGLNTNTGATTASNVKGMDLQQSAYYYGYNSNSEAIVTAKTMLDNRGIKSRFDADAFKNSSENAYWTNNNGVREVVFNPNASEQTILEEIAIHELTHDLMSSENSKNVLNKQNIVDYVSTLDDYEAARKNVEKTYAKQLKGLTAEERQAYINEEVVADVIGKNLGSQEYIRRLIDDEPSIAKNIYDWVVNKVANKNGVKNEKAYWNNVKNNFEKAYNMEYQGKESQSDSKYSLKETLKIDDYSKLKQKYQKELKSIDSESPQLYNRSDLNRFGDYYGRYRKTGQSVRENRGFGTNGDGNIQTSTTGVVRGNGRILREQQNKRQNGSYTINRNEKKASFNAEELLRIKEEYSNQKEPVYTATITPNDFLKLTTNGETLLTIEKSMLKNNSFILDEEKLKQAEPIQLTIDPETNKVTTHEGRHRMLALRNEGIEKVDIVVTTISGSTKDIDTNKKGVSKLFGQFNSTGVEITNTTPITKRTSDSSFSMSKQLENQASNLVEEDIQTTNAMLDNFKSYLEENDITNPTQEDIDNSLIDLLSYDNDMTPAETLDYEKQYKEVVNEYLKENGSKFSKQNDKWNNFVDKNIPSEGTKTRLGDIKLPGLTNAVQNTVQQEVQKQTSNALLPIANELKQLNNNLNKVLNPNEISKLTPQDANTTPNLPGVKRNKVGDGKSKFFDNIKDKTNMLTEEQKTAILNDEDVKYYDAVTNKESLEKAFERLQNGRFETEKWLGKETENADATDVAEGWILLKQYADNGDTEGMVEVAKKLRNIGTKAGQTVQAFNIMSRLTPEGMVKYAQSELSEAYDRMVKNKSRDWIDQHREDFDLKPNEVQFIMDTMQEVSQMEDGYDKRVKLAEIQKLMTDKLPPAKGAGLKSWMRISMLFNPKTQVRNIAGNAVIAPVNYFGDLFASGVDKLISTKTGVRTTGTTKLSNYAKGFKKGLYESYNDFKKGINTRNIEGNRFEIGEGRSFNDKKLIGKGLNRVDNLLSFMLDAGDRGFYEAAFTNSINNQMVLNNTETVTQEMIDIATQEALTRTWQDNNTYSKAVLEIRKLLNLGRAYGLGDVLIPFAKTPANLTKAIVDYSPAGLINTLVKGNNLRKSLNNGQFTPKMQHEFVQSLGKATAGTMLYVLGYALAKAGITSGESDEDKDVSNFLKNALGVSSYSIKIGDKTFTYDWAQPIAAPLAITANVVNAQKSDKEQALAEAIVGSLDSAGSTLLEQSFLQSINDVLNNQDGIVSGLITELLELPARAIPTLSKQIVDLTDSTQRQTFEYDKPIKSAFNYAISKIPGLSKTLAPSVDTMGREIQRYGGKNNIFNVFFNPANVNTENVSESAVEIYRLYKETGETNIMPRVAPYYVNKNGEKIVLSSEQRTQYQKTSGKIIEDNISQLLKSSTYQNMDDETKASVINDIVNYSYNIAQKEVLGTEISQTYQKAYEYAKVGNISDYYELRNSIDDTNSTTKKESVKNYLINSNLSDKEIGALYSNYYSSESEINNVLTMKIPIKEFIKFDTADIEGSYNTNTGKTISGSKKNATIKFVNSLNLTKAQKAILIKSVYSTYDSYDNEIVKYVNNLNLSANDKKVLLKSIGFDNYDKDVVAYINSQNISKAEKEEKLKELGFTIRNGRVYY